MNLPHLLSLINEIDRGIIDIRKNPSGYLEFRLKTVPGYEAWLSKYQISIEAERIVDRNLDYLEDE